MRRTRLHSQIEDNIPKYNTPRKTRFMYELRTTLKKINYNETTILNNVFRSNTQRSSNRNKKQKIIDVEHDVSNIIESNVNYNDWISATRVQNYLLKDPLLDWLELYYNKTVETKYKMGHIDVNKEKSRLNILFEMGNKFEAEIYKYLLERFNRENVVCVTNYENVTNRLSYIKNDMNLTLNLMKQGIPILFQVPLINEDDNTYGLADMVVRSDWLNKLVLNPVLDEHEEKIQATKLNGKYHYRVIDIKWTTLHLCVDRERIRNVSRFPAYKGQLLIYNRALAKLQGYMPDKAYILAKSWKCDSKDGNLNEGYNCFDLLGQIQYNDWDNKYIESTDEAIRWVKRVRTEGNKWTCLPKPSVPELYPNMCNKNDMPYSKIKKHIAKELNELTDLWMVGPKNRDIGHTNSIFRWDDPNCNSESLGIYGKTVGPILNKIIEINQSRTKDILRPKIITNNDFNWQQEDTLDFYVDYEAINSNFYTRDINLENSKSESGVIYMIGIGYIENNRWIYKSIYMNNFSFEEEYRVVDEFVNIIKQRSANSNKRPKIYHWGHAERTMFNNVNKRHGYIWSQWKEYVMWIDLCNIFKKIPIVIKNAKKFSLKEVARALYNHKVIKTCWNNNMESGLEAMISASEYYKFMEQYNATSDKTEYNKQKEIFLEIIKYNEVDCKVMWEILDYLRKNHIGQNKILGKRKN